MDVFIYKYLYRSLRRIDGPLFLLSFSNYSRLSIRKRGKTKEGTRQGKRRSGMIKRGGEGLGI